MHNNQPKFLYEKEVLTDLQQQSVAPSTHRLSKRHLVRMPSWQTLLRSESRHLGLATHHPLIGPAPARDMAYPT